MASVPALIKYKKWQIQELHIHLIGEKLEKTRDFKSNKIDDSATRWE
jgi:hypothetical protein